MSSQNKDGCLWFPYVFFESVQDKSVCMEQSFDHIDPLWNEPWHSCRPQIKPEDDNDTIPIDNMVKSLTSHYFSHFDMYL